MSPQSAAEPTPSKKLQANHAAVSFKPDAFVADEDDELALGSPPWLPDLARICKLAVPSTATQVLRVVNYTVVLVMTGSLDEDAFAGIALGMSLSNILTTSPCIGLAALLDTLTTQEYGRSPSSPVMGLHLRRAFAACGIWIAVTTAFYLLIGELLAVYCYGDAVGRNVATFLRLSFLATGGLGLTTCLQKFLSAQHIVDVIFYAQVVAITTLVPALWLAVPHGVAAVSVATGISRLAGLGTAAYLSSRRPGIVMTFGTWARTEVFDPEEWPAFLMMGVPSVAVTCAERWSFEGMSAMAGVLGAAATSAWAILLNVWILIFTPCVGFYTAASTLVGSALGEERPGAAKRYARRAFVAHVVTMVTLCVALAAWPSVFFRFYPNSEEVHRLAASMAPVVAFAVFADTSAYVLQAVLRAAGFVRYLAALTLGAQWGVSMLMGVVLLVAWGSVTSLAVGLALGCCVQLIGTCLGVDRLDWHTAVANRRVPMDDLNTSVATSTAPTATQMTPMNTPAAFGRGYQRHALSVPTLDEEDTGDASEPCRSDREMSPR
jgi:MATE family multidrug resistance protein